MNWKIYAVAMMLFNGLGLLVVYALQRLQGFLPLNPQGFGAVSPDSSLNTAVSFATNTNWQGYGGETTMSYLTQMLALTVQNFVSAATGMAVLVALIRGIARHTAKTIGNFWVDLTRTTLYILLPLALVLALVLVSQGVVQTFSPYKTVPLLQPTTDANGNTVTAAGPGRRPGRLADRHQAAGHQRRRLLQRQLGASVRKPDPALQLPGDAVHPADPGGAVLHLRQDGGRHAPGLGDPGGDDDHLRGAAGGGGLGRTERQPGLRRAGRGSDADATSTRAATWKARRCASAIANSALWATATTAASNGSVNSMHDSFMPLGGLVPLWLMQLGEVIYGGVGSGLYGMLAFVIVAVFVAGLMVGRTPEYLGKKIEAYEMKMASLILLIPVFTALVGTAIGGHDAGGPGHDLQPRPARLQRNPVCLFLGHGQQRQRLRRAEREHAVL